MMEENLTLKEKVEKLEKFLEENPKKAKKILKRKLKLPRKARVKKLRLRKGWVGVVRIDENGSCNGERQKVEDFTFRTKDGTYHATDGREIIMWQGKYPVLFQQSWKINPINFRKKEGETNETYGQRYTMARMLSDTIRIKSKGGNIIIWIILGIAVIYGINYFLGGGAA